MVVNWDRLYGSTFHVDIPNFEGKIVTREDVTSVTGELDVRNR
jgi:hypothetical protein